MITKTRENPVPLYHQLKNRLLKDEIIRKKMRHGERFLSERVLMAKYKLSYPTVTRAVRELVYEGVLTTVHGKGTFVARSWNENNNSRKFSGINYKSIINVKFIGLIIHDIKDATIGEFVRGVQDKANSMGFNVIIYYNDLKEMKELKGYEYLIKEGIRNIISMPLSYNNRKYNEYIVNLQKRGVSLLFIDRYIKELKVAYVGTNNFKGAYQATEYLIKLGHKKIVYIGNSCFTSSKGRLEGYKSALKTNNISVNKDFIWEMSVKNNEEEGYRITRRNLKNFKDITAIFAMNDITAKGVYWAIRKNRLRVPEHISLIGFDNLSWTESFDVPLTTVAQPFYRIGKESARIIIEKIQKKQTGIKHIEFSPELIIRKSTGGA